MSLRGYDRVAFEIGSRRVTGEVVNYLPDGTVAGPDGQLVVDIDGAGTYRVYESDVERLTDAE